MLQIFVEKFFFCDFQQSAEIWTIGRLENIWYRDLRHEQRTVASAQRSPPEATLDGALFRVILRK